MIKNPTLRTTSTLGTAVLVLGASLIGDSAGAEGPWRLDDHIPTDLVSLTVAQRTRYEYLSEAFDTNRVGDAEDQIVVLRTLVHGRLMPTEWLTIGAELQDSRAYVSRDTRVDTSMVNAAELMRAYAEVNRDDVFGGTARLTAGRITLDVGSRRLVARNRFRNTINGFTGVDFEWQSGGANKTVYRAFWALPVDWRPLNSEIERLWDNDVQIDRESLEVQFWGIATSSRTQSGRSLDLYFFGLHENDRPDRATRNRTLYTTGGRYVRDPSPGRIDFNIESVLQWGESKKVTSDPAPIDHFAHLQHIEAGFTFDVPWRPRLAIEWDYASGDKDPADDKNGRFDTLYGARRFEFGPTGIYGAIARANINTPGVRFEVEPAANVSAFLAYRAVWLAQKRDAWAGTGVVDEAGDSGSFLGDQIEIRVRWRPLPGNLHLEAGWAHLFRGQFMKQAPNAVATRDSDYVYTQASIHF